MNSIVTFYFYFTTIALLSHIIYCQKMNQLKNNKQILQEEFLRESDPEAYMDE